MSDAPRPVDGLKVLDFTHVLAGPFATRVLGDMGADIVKVNSQSRALAANMPQHPYYLMWNRNKRALALDMANPEARPLCRKLCNEADVVIDNFSVGVLDRWGVGYAEVKQTNPGVIYVQMSGMGDGGPWSKFVTYAPTIHALAGLTHLTGVPGREDIGLGYSYNDHQAGLHGAVAILAALASRRRTGQGQRVDVSQFEVGVNFAGPSLLDFFANGKAARATGNELPYDNLAPHNVYQCAPLEVAATVDEKWVAIACMTQQQWLALVSLMGDPPWATQDQFSSAAARWDHREILDRHISGWTATQDCYAVMHRCQHAGVPAGVVQNGADLMERDPQLSRVDFAHRIDDAESELGQTWADRLPIRFEDTPVEEYRRTRTLGEDNVAILSDWLSMDEGAVRASEQAGLLQ